ncbi:hypothetical protein Tco_0200882 [Tanacetum coccineum]
MRQNAVQNDGNEVGQNAVQNPGIQNVENMNGLSVDSEIANQYGNGNVVTSPAEGNDNGINGQQASTSGTQSDNALVYDLDGSTEYTDLQTELDRMKEKLENCIIKKEKEYTVLWNNWLQIKLGDLKGKSSDTQCASNTLDLVSPKLKDENMSLESQVLNYAKENAHLKTIYKNLFDSIKVTQAQTNSIIDSLQKQLYETIYENAKLRAQLFDRVSEPKGTTKGTRGNEK